MATIKIKPVSAAQGRSDEYELTLLPAPDETNPKAEGLQSELRRAEDQLNALGHKPAAMVGLQKALGMSSWLLGTFAISGATAAKSWSPVLVEWLKGRAGRRVRLKKGDIEIEAGTVEEIARVWEIAHRSDQSTGS